MMKHCEHSWQKSSALLIQASSASITYVMQKHQNSWLLTIFLLCNLKECYHPQESFKEPICTVADVGVQYLANEFWLRWRGEYLQILKVRQKWVQLKRNLAVGDIVISKESESTRNKWPLGKVVQVYPSDDGYVRKVRLLMADGNLDDSGKRQRPPSYLDRPIHKLVLLLTADEVFQEDVFHEETREVPIEEPTKNNWKTLQRFHCQWTL